MRVLVLPLVLALASGCTVTAAGTATAGASAKPSTAPSARASAAPAQAAVPEPGSQVDAAFWAANHPQVAKGTVWTYQTAMVYQTRPGDETPYEETIALTEVAGPKLTFTFTDKAPAGAGVADRVEPAEGRVGPLVPGDAPPWTYFGPEDVTVPAGTYKGALKLIAADAIVAGVTQVGGTLWLVPDTGVVKFVSSGDYHLRRELKAVVKP